MRIFILILVFSLAHQGWGQINQSNQVGNTNVNQQEPEVDTEEATEEEAPASAIPVMKEAEKKRVQSRGARAKYKMESVKQDKVQSAESDSYSTSTIQYDQNATAFGSTYTQSSSQRTQRTPSMDQQRTMDEAVDFFEKNAPNSFEYNYFKYASGQYNVELFEFLSEAERLKPNNSDVQVHMAGYYMIKGQNAKVKEYHNKLISSKRLSTGTIDYSEDILLSSPKNATLITHGFKDTHGAWNAQQVRGVRKDVTIVSLDFLQSEYYRNSLKSKGYQLPSQKVINTKYLSEFCRLNADKNLAISSTTPKEYFLSIKDNVYITGLVLEYRKDNYQNFKRNEDLWNNVLRKKQINNPTDYQSKSLNSNYLPMLFQLRKVYGQMGDQASVKRIDESIDKIGAQCNKYKQVQLLKSAY